MAIVTVALAGTPEAATADFVCDGSDDQVEINAALVHLAGLGGGTLQIAGGLYKTSEDIDVGGSNITIVGAVDRSTIIEVQPNTPQGSAIAIFGDNVSVKNITVDASLVKTNGISFLATTTGLVENCLIKTFADHTYGIWMLESDGIVVTGNEVDGGAVQHRDQEGIESSASKNITITNNIVRNIGGNGIFVFNWNNSDNILIKNNQVENTNRSILIFHEGSGYVNDVVVELNTLSGAKEAGIYVHIASTALAGGYMSGIKLFDNEISTATAAEGALPYVSAIFLENNSGLDYDITNVVIEQNLINDVYNTIQSGSVNIFSFKNFSLINNQIHANPDNSFSRALNIFNSSEFALNNNDLFSSGGEAIAVVSSEGFSILGNDISDFSVGAFTYPAIVLFNSDNGDVTGNRIYSALEDRPIDAFNVYAPTGYFIQDNAVYGSAGSNLFNAIGEDFASYGLGGDDIYLVDSPSDLVFEAANEGNDEVRASVSYALGAGVHVERLVTNNATGTIAINLTGNELVQELIGNAGANVLDGGAEADTLHGLGGNDIYIVDNASDVVVEVAGEGIDEVRISLNYTLAANAHVEKLGTTNNLGTNAIDLIANAHVLELTGNAGENLLLGNALANILDGGVGADAMIGLGGDDIYIVDNIADQVTEISGGGTDEIRTSVSYTMANGVSVERLVTTNAAGTGAINLTGNALVQDMTGNAGANVLDGGGGNDTLRGLGGDDVYLIDNAGVTIVENAGAGYDTIATSISFTLGSNISIELLKLKDAAATTALNLTGNNLDNRLEGNAGANTLNGGAGADMLAGLGGDDIYFIDNVGDQIIEGAGEGSRDVVYSSVSYTLDAASHVEILSTWIHALTTAINLTGNTLANQLIGNAGSNILDGGGATTGRDQLQGLGGDDIYIIRKGDEIINESAGQGSADEVRSAVSYMLGNGVDVERMATIDAGATSAINLTGNALAQDISGNAGTNILDGGAGADVLRGLGGDDVYLVDNAGDQIIEAAGEGNDEVRASVSYVLGAGVHVERLVTNNAAATTAINLTGNELVQELVGNAGANILDGGAGADVLRGLGGNDIYVVDDAGDAVFEAAGEGSDEVRASVSYALSAGVHAERLMTTNASGTGAINLTGNALVQEIVGNAGTNILDGGAGADTLTGLGGDDVYIVDDTGDVVVEASGEGNDEVRSAISYALGTGVHVERLDTISAAGTEAINITGNELVQSITGNAGANILDGGADADTLTGLGGDDVYIVDNAGDVVIEAAGEGNDEARSSVSYVLGAGAHVERLLTTNAAGTGAINLTGNELAQDITGNAGANILDGGADVDIMRGLGGDDIYIIDNAGDVVVEAAAEGNDEVRASVSYALGAGSHVERLVTTDAAGTGGINLTGNDLVQELVGNAGANTLDGGGGADVLRGLGGDDVYFVDSANDQVLENADEGSDEVRASDSYTLGTGVHVERLVTTNAAGIGAVNLTGNGFVQDITGNAGANTLDGGAGADILAGLGGDDVYVVDDAGDVVVEVVGDGSDEVRSSVSYALATDVSIERLVTNNSAGTSAINFTGNALVQEIVGNAGANVLDGGAGADTLTGLGGDDIYVVDDAGDAVAEAAGEGSDEVRASVNSYTLDAASHVEILSTWIHALTTAINLTGNALANQLIGNAGLNILDGGGATSGRDQLQGLGGDDIYIIRKGDEIIYENAGQGIADEVRAAVSYTLGNGVDVERMATIDVAANTAINLTGNALAQDITGNAGANILDGGAGADVLRGLGGDDVYVIDNVGDVIVEAAGEGTDEARTSVSYALGTDARLERLMTTNTAGTDALDLTGNAHVLEIIGNAGVNQLTGGSGNNILDGDAGADTLTGLGGDDIYIVDDAGDAVAEAAGEGSDEVRASVSYTLGAGVHVERLITNNAAGTGLINLTGNELAQELIGNAGMNILDGGTGADTLVGLGGDDIYIVDDIADVVIEAAGEGSDEVRSSVSYILGAGARVERLVTNNAAGTVAINLTGNAHVLDIVGNAGNNALTGGAGNNILDGGAGADTLAGLGGDDIYIVDDAGDAVVEAAGEGSDEVRASVNYTLGTGVHVERLVTTNAAGVGAFNLTGNALAQDISGNAGANVLDGGGGNDVLRGLGGDDTYVIDNAGVTIVENAGAGYDTIATSISYTLGTNISIELLKLKDAAATTALNLTGNNLDNRLEGNAGANTLNGGAGADVLAGLGGDDIYYIDNAADQVIEGANEGSRDVVYSSVSYTLDAASHVEILSTWIHALTTAINLTGNALANQLIGNAGLNILDGGGATSGRDQLQGLGGDDIYIIRKGDEIIYENAGQGIADEVRAAVSYTLGNGVDVERMATIDVAANTAINLTGNALAQDITGNAGANTLDGGAGADVLRGLEGNDSLFGGSGSDIAVYRGLRVNYSILTSSGSVQIVDNDAILDGDDGTDTLAGVEFAQFKDGEQVGLVAPIILDLDGRGVETLNASESRSRFDMDGDGVVDRTSWFGATEGLLVLDRDGNGTVSNAGEFSFVEDVVGARSDLEGLRAFDSNADGQLSALDERFGDFLVWADRDGDGAVDDGEMLTLSEAGVASINLAGEAVSAATSLDDVAVINRGSYTRTDGTEMEFLDVALTYMRGAEDSGGGQRTATDSTDPATDAAVSMLKVQPMKAPSIDLAGVLRAVEGTSLTEPASQAAPSGGAPRLDINSLSDAAIPLLLQINQAMASFAPREGEADKGISTETIKPVDYFT